MFLLPTSESWTPVNLQRVQEIGERQYYIAAWHAVEKEEIGDREEEQEKEEGEE